MFDTLREDFGQYYKLLPPDYGRWKRFLFFLSCQGQWALVDYRFRRWLLTQNYLVRLLLRWPAFFYHIWTETLTGISIPTGCQIGKGLYIGHFVGIFVHDHVVMGEYCALSQGVSIGLGGKGERLGVPQVGHHVYFAPGCKVVSKIKIGNHVSIGANAVVISDVPDNCTAVGVPARAIPATNKGK